MLEDIYDNKSDPARRADSYPGSRAERCPPGKPKMIGSEQLRFGLGGPVAGAPELRRCTACGFDPTAFTKADAIGTLRSFTPRWRETFAGLAVSRLESTQQRGTSALQCLSDHVHLAKSLAGGRTPPGAHGDVDALLAELAGAVEARLLGAPGDLTEDLHLGTHLLSAAGRALAGSERRSDGPGLTDGVVASVNASSGGLPKRPIGATTLTARSVAGDRQATRRHHGRPWQAVCLWSMELVAALQAEGHRLAPGVAGENVTISGLDWAALRPGNRLLVGAALVELTAWTLPCRQLTPYFVNGDFRRIDNALHPGWSRMYGAVLGDGEVRPGDRVGIVDGGGVCAPGANGDNPAAEHR
ncbi:MAG: hypothetical protein NVS3B12_03120 [Acidimicrobiales bacterium]